MAQRSIVLAISPENADALLDGKRRFDHRTIRPKELPARTYLAVTGTASVVGECTLGAPERKTREGLGAPGQRAATLPHAAPAQRVRTRQGPAKLPVRGALSGGLLARSLRSLTGAPTPEARD